MRLDTRTPRRARDGYRPIPGCFTGSYDGAVKCWDANCLRVATETELATSVAPRAGARATSHSLVAIGSDDDVVRLWDPASNVIAHTLSGHRGSVHAIEWSRSNEYALATGGAEGDDVCGTFDARERT